MRELPSDYSEVCSPKFVDAKAGTIEPKYLKGAVEKWTRPADFVTIAGAPLVIYRFKNGVSIAYKEDYKVVMELFRKTIEKGDKILLGLTKASIELQDSLTETQDNVFICHELEGICRKHKIHLNDKYAMKSDLKDSSKVQP